ncbi:claudin-11-like [Ptychodera flava]|uniref:claudin-11-like n=1 Tax=Ptychodera flava TaxID=63121 RepID=UPI00396A1C76
MESDSFKSSREYFSAYTRIPTLVLIGLVLTVLVFVGLACGSYSTYWVTFCVKECNTTRGYDSHISGLWQTCEVMMMQQSTASMRHCIRFNQVPEFVVASRALMVMASVGCLAAFICILIGLKKDVMLVRLAGTFLCLTGTMITIAVIIFPVLFKKMLDKELKYNRMGIGYGLASTMGVAVVCWIAAVIVLMPVKRSTYPKLRLLSPESQSLLYRKY